MLKVKINSNKRLRVGFLDSAGLVWIGRQLIPGHPSHSIYFNVQLLVWKECEQALYSYEDCYTNSEPDERKFFTLCASKPVFVFRAQKKIIKYSG